MVRVLACAGIFLDHFVTHKLEKTLPLRKMRQAIVSALLLLALLVQGTWALAGTTGSISGNVTAEGGKPLSGALITVVSPSQTSSTTTDASGHFIFLSLAPDTYSVSVSKEGYASVSQAGVSVFADNNQVVSLATSQMKTIANVTSRAAGSLVKSGTTSDVYSVNAATQQAISSLGGGTNLNNAYSAIYSQPGVSSSVGNYGVGQVFYIRGSNYNQVGYEFDGVPVNRAFDNYAGSSLSSLGQQELQVYTGAGPAGTSTATVGGYVNQVIKTGTFPGFGSVSVGVGGPTFYHKLFAEAGGASPNRLFSYYVGLGGYNQEYRQINAQNGGNIDLSSGLFGSISEWTTPFYGNGNPACLANGLSPNTAAQNQGGCIAFGPAGGLDYQSTNSDRENVVNMHFGIPHKKDGGRDDVQLLWTNSSFLTGYAESINDLGGLAGLNYQFGGDFCGQTGYCVNGQPAVPYEDGYIFAPGTAFGSAAGSAVVDRYYFPSSGDNRLSGVRGPMPDSLRNTIHNDSNILKLQYQKNIGTNAYFRAYGYSLYSDWLQNGPTFGQFGYTLGSSLCCSGAVSRDYELDAHTRGGELQFADQINSKNLLTVTANYVTSSVVRFNNGTMSNGRSSAATSLTDGKNCYAYKAGTVNSVDPVTGGVVPTPVAAGAQVSCFSSLSYGTYGAPVPGAIPAAAAAAGATWQVTVPGERGTFNSVRPEFSSQAIVDEFRPNDKLLVNFGLRAEQFKYNLATPGSDFPFWYNAAANSYCYNTTTLSPLVNPLKPGQLPPATPQIVTGSCPTGYAHPSSTDPANTAGIVFGPGNGGVINRTTVSPRVGFTYTVNPDTVIRGSLGRYAEPMSTAYVQYLDKSGRSSSSFNFTNFFAYGFNTPTHQLVPQVSNNADLSLEKHIKGTDISYKLSPFYRYTTNQLNTISIGPNFASALNVGTQKTMGVEFALSKGDASRDGLAGQLSYTYTRARVKFSNLSNGRNTIDPLNDYIKAYNALTQAGGGSPCYDPTAAPTSTGNPGSSCAAATDIKNPYYNDTPKPLLDRNGWYDVYPNEFPYQPTGYEETSFGPNTFSGFLNYKHQKFAITPNFQLVQGNAYGSPVDIYGYDPRTCASNQAGSGIAAGDPQKADFLSCNPSLAAGNGLLAIPNPQTGQFANLAQYRNPWILNINTSISYDLSNKVKANLILANVLTRCFGGSSTPWSSQYKPNNRVCGYGTNGSTYQSNFWNGTGPNDAINGPVNGVLQSPYAPFSGVLPFNAYLNFQIKI